MSNSLSLLRRHAALLVLTAAAAAAQAEGLSTNVNLVSQYRFRGIDQTWGQPALQGGADWSHASGAYAGAWASNVSGNSYPGGSLEFDAYGGYNGTLAPDWTWTAGAYGYLYPGANINKSACGSAAFAAPCTLPSQRFDTLELNAGVGWKWLSYKLSVAVTDYFGANVGTGYAGGTRGTRYHDISATLPLADNLSLALHLGRTDVRARYGALSADYTDYRVALSRSFDGGWSASAAVAGANNNAFFRPPAGGLSMANGNTRSLNKSAAVLQVGRTF